MENGELQMLSGQNRKVPFRPSFRISGKSGKHVSNCQADKTEKLLFFILYFLFFPC